MKRRHRLSGAETQNGTRAVLAHAPLWSPQALYPTKKRPPAPHSRPPLAKKNAASVQPLKRTKTAVKRYSERLIIPRPSLKNAAARAKPPQHLRLSAGGGIHRPRKLSPFARRRHTKHISHSTAPRIIRAFPAVAESVPCADVRTYAVRAGRPDKASTRTNRTNRTNPYNT